MSVSTNETINRYRDNPVISESNRAWTFSTWYEGGRYFVYVSDGANNVTDLYIGDSLYDLTQYSNNPVLDFRISDIQQVDGIYQAAVYDRNGGSNRRVRLASSTDLVNWTDHGVILNESGIPWATSDGFLHPTTFYDYGRYSVWPTMIDGNVDRGVGIVSSRYPDLTSLKDWGEIIPGQSGWESSQITNAHPHLIDGAWRMYYSGGSSGSSRDIGIRWGEYPTNLGSNALDSAIMVADDGSFEDDYVNIGDLNAASRRMHYFGFGSEDTGLVAFEYDDLTTTSLSADSEATLNRYDGSTFTNEHAFKYYDGGSFITPTNFKYWTGTLWRTISIGLLPSGLTHYYKMDEGSGNTIADSESSSDVTEQAGDFSWPSDSGFVGGTGVFFDGSDDRANGPYLNALDPENNALSVAFTIDKSGTDMTGDSNNSLWQNSLENASGGMTSGIGCSIGNDSTGEIEFEGRDSGSNVLFRSGIDASGVSGLFRVCITQDSNNNVTTYLNGNSVTDTGRNGNSNAVSSDQFALGYAGTNTSFPSSSEAEVTFDAFAVYNVELSASEVQTDYDAQPFS